MIWKNHRLWIIYIRYELAFTQNPQAAFVVFWWTQYCITLTGILCGRFLAKISRGLRLRSWKFYTYSHATWRQAKVCSSFFRPIFAVSLDNQCCAFPLTTLRQLTCTHAKLFRTVKQRTCIHDLRHYSRNSYSNFGRYAIFSESSGSHLGDPRQKALQTMIEPTLFVDFCLIPLSNTCSVVRPARNVNREIFLHCQEGFCVGKFACVVDQAVLDNRPLHKHFRRYRLCSKSFISVSLHSFFDMKNN